MRVEISKKFPDSKHFLHQVTPGLLRHPLLPIPKKGVPLFVCRAFATAVATFVFHSSGDVTVSLCAERHFFLIFAFRSRLFAVCFHLLFSVFSFRRSASFHPVSRRYSCIFARFLPASTRPGFAGSGASSSRGCLGQLALAAKLPLPSL